MEKVYLPANNESIYNEVLGRAQVKPRDILAFISQIQKGEKTEAKKSGK